MTTSNLVKMSRVVIRAAIAGGALGGVVSTLADLPGTLAGAAEAAKYSPYVVSNTIVLILYPLVIGAVFGGIMGVILGGIGATILRFWHRRGLVVSMLVALSAGVGALVGVFLSYTFYEGTFFGNPLVSALSIAIGGGFGAWWALRPTPTVPSS